MLAVGTQACHPSTRRVRQDYCKFRAEALGSALSVERKAGNEVGRF